MIHVGVGDTIEAFRKNATFLTVQGLLKQYFNIAFLMGRPQELPGGRSQMQLGIALALVTYVLALLVPFGFDRALLQAVVDIVCTGAVLWIALCVVGHPARFEQAFGGLCGASAFINLAALPLYSFTPVDVDAAAGSSMALADFILLVWGFSLMAHIIRHTFETSMVISVVMSVTFFIVLSSVLANFWPPQDSDPAAGAEEVSWYRSPVNLPAPWAPESVSSATFDVKSGVFDAFVVPPGCLSGDCAVSIGRTMV